MSLFQAIDFWTTSGDSDEIYYQNSLKVSSLDENYDLIITGSKNGVLRIYKPGSDLDQNSLHQGFNPTDLLLEKDLQNEIIQIEVGKLVSGSQSTHIAVLHSKVVRVFSFSSKTGQINYGNQYNIKQMYEHKLRRAAANFVVGSFGKSNKRDFISVQSLDGLLTFFEQECFSFCCFLPNFLLPGPLSYLNYCDCFVTAGSSWMIQCFNYKVLSDAGEYSTQEDVSGKRITEEWIFNAGEEIFNMIVLSNDSKKENIILSLGRKHLFCCNGKGKLNFMKRLECPTSCFTAYLLGDEDRVFSLIVTETKTLLIYGNTTLMWSVQLSFLPVALSKADFTNVKGALVMLSEEGRLHCSYLGTEPHIFTAIPLSLQQLDLDQCEEELGRLQTLIRKRLNTETNQRTTSVEESLTIKLLIDQEHKALTNSENLQVINEINNICHVIVEIIPHIKFDELQVVIFIREPLKASGGVKFYKDVTEKIIFESNISLEKYLDIVSLEFQIVVTSLSNVSVPQVFKKMGTIPLKMSVQSCEPSKSGENRIILDLSKETEVPLHKLFPEFMGESNLSQTSNAVAFKNKNGSGDMVTILQAKSSQKYRLQSNSLSSLNIFLTEIKERLKQFYNKDSSFTITYSADLPVQKLLLNAKEHYEVAQEIKRLLESLDYLTKQYKITQKCLISKLKDKNATTLHEFATIIDEINTNINDKLLKLQEEENKMKITRNKLECSLNLLTTLVSLMGIENHTRELITSTFECYVNDEENQNWEDVIDASLCFLLRTILYQSETDKLQTVHESFEEIKDFTKFENHLKQVLERIRIDTKYSLPNDENKEVDEEKVSLEENEKSSVVLQPIGSQYGESSLREISAKRSLLGRRQKVPETS